MDSEYKGFTVYEYLSFNFYTCFTIYAYNAVSNVCLSAGIELGVQQIEVTAKVKVQTLISCMTLPRLCSLSNDHEILCIRMSIC